MSSGYRLNGRDLSRNLKALAQQNLLMLNQLRQHIDITLSGDSAINSRLDTQTYEKSRIAKPTVYPRINSSR